MTSGIERSYAEAPQLRDQVAGLERQNAAMREAIEKLDDIEWRRSMYRAGIIYDDTFADLGVFSPMKFFDDFSREFRALAALNPAPES